MLVSCGLMSSLEVRKLDVTDPAIRSAVIAYLEPVEQHALFVLGNLLSGFPGSYYYVVQSGGQWLGITGYYERFASMTPYCTDPEAMRVLTAHIARAHGRIEYMNAIASVGAAACEQLCRLGYAPANDPRQVLMEAEMAQTPAALPEEAVVRRARAGEEYAVADLMRYLTRPDDPSPPTQAEVARQDLRYRLVAEVDGKLAATASSNGLAIRCFQILGVVTHPEYRRRGYASAACAALMRGMHARGARRAVLFTGVDNTSAQQCYERLGFGITGDYLMAKFRPR
jgi:predicted GNAT family acetyltransferase